MDAFNDVDKYYDYLLDSQNENDDGESFSKGSVAFDDIEEEEEEVSESVDDTASEVSDDVDLKKI